VTTYSAIWLTPAAVWLLSATLHLSVDFAQLLLLTDGRHESVRLLEVLTPGFEEVNRFTLSMDPGVWRY